MGGRVGRVWRSEDGISFFGRWDFVGFETEIGVCESILRIINSAWRREYDY